MVLKRVYDALTSKVLRKISDGFDAEKLAARQKYSRMLKLGMVKELVDFGQSDYVIKHYASLKDALGDGVYMTVSECITKEMLTEYLRSHDDANDFFLIHPQGLEVLEENQYSGFVASHETQFCKIVKNFPMPFRRSEEFCKKYLERLAWILDRPVSYLLS